MPVTCFQELDRFVTQAGAKLESTLKFDDLVDAPLSENMTAGLKLTTTI
jgi:hypothetical protein